jgi:hypothetical protein
MRLAEKALHFTDECVDILVPFATSVGMVSSDRREPTSTRRRRSANRQVGVAQLFLAAKAIIKRGLGHAGVLDHPIDADAAAGKRSRAGRRSWDKDFLVMV